MLAGEEALLRASRPLSETLGSIPESRRWFAMGCQGPDIFYHNQRTRPSGLHYGSLAHRRQYGAIVEGAFRNWLGTRGTRGRLEGGASPDPAFAWLLGFATHAALDRALHPFVVAFSGWPDPSLPGSERFRSCHPFLERILDLLFLKRLRGLSGAEFDLENLLPLDGRASPDRERPDEDVAALLLVGLSRAYPQAVAADFLIARRIANTLADARAFFRMTNPARTCAEGAESVANFDDRAGMRSIAVVYPLEVPPGVDFANEARITWAHPAGDGRTSEASAHELFEAGVAEASRCISIILEEEAHPHLEDGVLAAELGLGSLSIADAEGHAARPTVSSPLPLREIMEAEFQVRLERARRLSSR